MTKSIALVTAFALMLHLVFGWMWVFLAAVPTGWLVEKRAWVVGGTGVFLAWLLLIGYNFLMAPSQTSEMTRVMGEIIGGLPSLFIPALTLLIGFVLGAAGGSVGTTFSALQKNKTN